MNTIIVNSFSQVPFIGVQVRNFENAISAFKYAKQNYFFYGYNIAYFSTDINTLFIGKV